MIKFFFFLIPLFFISCSIKTNTIKYTYIKNTKFLKENIKKIKLKKFENYKIPYNYKIIWNNTYLPYQVLYNYKNYIVIKIFFITYSSNDFIKSINVKYNLKYIQPYYSFELKKNFFFDKINFKKNLLIINKKNKIKKIINKHYFIVFINKKKFKLKNLKFFVENPPITQQQQIINFNNLLDSLHFIKKN